MSFTSASNKVEFKTSDETNNSLNELFNVHSLCRQKPYIERQLPKSFFIQPSGSNFSCDHHKGFSSPANLEETYRAGPGNAINYHSKQRSLDSQCGSQLYSEFNNMSNRGIKSPSPIIDSAVSLKVEAGKLPPGFEMVIDESCRVYFLNHRTKETTWYDPRLPEEIQSWGMSLKDLQELHIHYMHTLSSGHSSARKQTSIALTRPVQQQFSQADPRQLFPDSTNQKLGRRVSGSNISSNATDKSPFPGSAGHSMMQYFVHTNNNNGSNNYQEMCHLYPNCSSIQGSLSHSSNSSCSNLSTCLNGLNLSPTPAPNSLMTGAHCHYGGRMGPIGLNTIDQQHSHQDSLDSGIGLSVVSQSYLSANAASDDCKSFDMPIKLEDCDNLESGSIDNIDDFMEIDISSLNFC